MCQEGFQHRTKHIVEKPSKSRFDENRNVFDG